MARITKDMIREARGKINKSIREVCFDGLKASKLLDHPHIEEIYRNAFPYKTPDERPAFAAAALSELLERKVMDALPSWMID